MKLLGARISAKFIAQIFENYPEASEGPIECIDWKNTGNPVLHSYTFRLHDNGGRHFTERTLTFPDMFRGLHLFAQAKGRGELAGCPWTREGRGWFDADYDRNTVDAICQMALFGEVRD